jgi:hypothetical protein
MKIWFSMYKGGTKTWAHHLDFQSKNFPYAFFNVKKRRLYVNFSIPLCAKWCFFQGSIRLVDVRFCWHVPNSPWNKNLKFLNPYLLYKMVFLAKTLLYPLSTWKNLFFPALNLMILQKVWNKCVRFGGHINIQVSYKILCLEVLKKTSILHNLSSFQKGLF